MTQETVVLTADVVLFTDRAGVRCVLLIRRGWPPHQGALALPGGKLNAGERFEAAARRELAEETGLDTPARLEMVGVYDAPGRDSRGRYVSVAYTALVPEAGDPTAGDDADEAMWVPLEQLLADLDRAYPQQQLAFDHEQVLRDAIEVSL